MLIFKTAAMFGEEGSLSIPQSQISSRSRLTLKEWISLKKFKEIPEGWHLLHFLQEVGISRTFLPPFHKMIPLKEKFKNWSIDLNGTMTAILISQNRIANQFLRQFSNFIRKCLLDFSIPILMKSSQS